MTIDGVCGGGTVASDSQFFGGTEVVLIRIQRSPDGTGAAGGGRVGLARDRRQTLARRG